MNNLGVLYQNLSRYSEAEPLCSSKSIRASRSDFLKPIFMMKSAEDGGASNRISGRNTMPMLALLRKRP
jgi:hypothetical protein